jgi:hypothetical protein
MSELAFKHDIAVLSVPTNIKIGNAWEILYRGQPLEVTWLDKDHLNVEDEIRTIRSVKTYKRYKTVEFHLVY